MLQQQPMTTENNSSNFGDRLKVCGDNFADGVGAALTGYTTGLSLGNFDEAIGAANIAGLALDKIPYTRGGGIVGRKFIKQGINSFADKMKNVFYKNNEEGEYNY